MIFYMFTLIVTSSYFGIILTSDMDHTAVQPFLSTCGPWESFSIASDYAMGFLDDYIVYFLYNFSIKKIDWII